MNCMHQPGTPTLPCINIVSMPQMAEAISRDDNWTGTKDSKARRRAQNRLNTRAYRKRKALAKKSGISSSQAETLKNSEGSVKCRDVEQQSVSVVPASYHLITLIQFNAIRALAVNRTLITGSLATPLDCSEETIRVIHYPTMPQIFPPKLLPTALQQTVPHGDWIDLFPCPEGRDRLIRAAGTFDEDELWADCIGGLYEGFPDDEIERRGIIAWSPPWDITGWEMSEGFMRKWGWLFKGLPEVLEATNRWRIERGEDPFSNDDCTSHV